MRTNNQEVELKVVVPIYKVKKIYNEQTNNYHEEESFHKELIVRKWIKKDAISSYGETLTTKNTIAKSRCIIFDKYSSRDYIVKHSVDELREVLNGGNHIGYK